MSSKEMKTERAWKRNVWGEMNTSPNHRERRTHRAVLRFRTLSSARSSHSSRPQRRCLRPRCFLWGENRAERASDTSVTGVRKLHHALPASLFLIIVTLKVNDGDPEHAALQPSINRERKEAHIWRADTAERYSPNILFSFVEFLSQIFSRGLTGDLNHGQLLAIASHVAGGLTHTVIVVFLYQKVCGWSESFKNNVITARESNKPDTEALRFRPKNNSAHDREKGEEKKKENRCHRSLSMKASNEGKVERKLCGIYLISAEHRHITNPPNGIFKQSFYCIILLQLSWTQFQVNVTFEWILPRMGRLSHSNFKSRFDGVFFLFFLQCYSINAHLEPGQHSLCTARECKQWRFLFKTNSNAGVKQDKFCLCDVTRPSANSYPACEPSCSCSSPAGTGSHSRCGRRWCCRWRSTRSRWEWTCSPPTAAGGTEAATANGTRCVSDGRRDGKERRTRGRPRTGAEEDNKPTKPNTHFKQKRKL